LNWRGEQGRNQKIELKKIKILVVLLFRLNILILLREGLEKNYLQGPRPLQPPVSDLIEREIMPIAPFLYRI
jgi:hypothetical protein